MSGATLAKIYVSGNTYLQYDKEDTWIAVGAENGNWYTPMSLEDAKLLLPKLKELIEIIESKEAE